MILLDTLAFLWAATEPERLGEHGELIATTVQHSPSTIRPGITQIHSIVC